MSSKPSNPADKGVPTGAERAATSLRTAHATIRLEHGPGGVIARVDHDRRDGTEYAGPLPPATVDALREVADTAGGAR